MRYYDISPLISEKLAVFPGDTAFTRQVSLEFVAGDHLALSAIKATLHLGAHADSSSHYHPEGKGVEQRALDMYFGDCQVIEVNGLPGQRILLSDIQEKQIKAKRILFKTCSFLNSNQWQNDFNSLSPELIEWLSNQGVVMVGIDTPSVDPADSKDLASHQSLWRCGMAVLEGLELQTVPSGLYKLIALPLRIKDGDASPVRAILIADNPWVDSGLHEI